MPITPPTAALVLTPSLLAVGCLGVGTPKLAFGIACGLSRWAASVQVPLVAVGTAGAGAVSFPLTVPSFVLLPALLASFSANGMLGVFTPLFATGLAQGVSSALSSGVIVAAIPGVGSGAATATFRGSATVAMQQGFADAQLVGVHAARQARAIGQGLDAVFAAFVMPVPVVGPGGPSPATSVITGKLL